MTNDDVNGSLKHNATCKAKCKTWCRRRNFKTRK